MPTLADIYSGIATAKRQAGNFIRQPVSTLQEIVALANDEAKQLNRQTALSAQGARQELRGQPMTAEQAAADQALTQQMIDAMNVGGITVWHGSPYKFTKFDSNKIGAGEGAQVYGHGLYVAQNPKVAETYKNIEPTGAAASPRRMLFNKEVEAGTPEYKVAQLVDELGLSKARKFILDWSKNPSPDQIDYVNKASDIVQKLTKKSDAKNLGTGNLYKIDLHDKHIENMLDWDRPINQQSKNVQEILKNSDIADIWKAKYGHDIEKSKPYADMVYKTVAEKLGSQAAASDYFKKLGLSGIKYLDEMSRNAKNGTRNFVIFPGNEHLLNIENINGNLLK